MQRIASDRRFIAGLLTLLLVAALGISGALAMMGQSFPGFLVLSNGVVASATAPGWPATVGGEIYQREVIAVDGRSVDRGADVYQIARSHPVGTPLVYRFRDTETAHVLERAIETRLFSTYDAGLLYGVYLLNGLALGLAALVVQRAGRGSAAADSTVPFLMLGALWALSAMDLYGPYRLFRFHALCEPLLFPAIVQMAIGFPRALGSPEMRRVVVGFAYCFAICLAIGYQAALSDPHGYVAAHLLATSAGGLALVGFVVSQAWRFVSNHFRARMRPTSSVFIGTLLALLFPIALTVGESLTGGTAAQSAIGFSLFVFPISILYATTRDGLFD